MKKPFITTLTILFLFCNFQFAKSQNLPSSGDITFEIMVDPFSSNPVSFNEFRGRLFLEEDMAFRMQGDLNYTSEKLSDDYKDTEFFIAFAPGVELHAIRDNRFAFYYGAELELALRNSREHRDDTTNKNVDGEDFFGIALNALIGADIHFLNRLYTGIEVGYGISRRSYLDREINGETIENDAVEFTIGRFASSRFRLGFKF